MLYSLYKQATEGPVKSQRPGVFDLLGRAKWDAWKKREKLTRLQSQESYVETLLSILRNFSDKPQAVELLRELRDYGKDRLGRGRDDGSLQEYDETVSSSSLRSASPPPPSSRRSYHSAQPSQVEYPLQEGEETPRKYRRPYVSDDAYRQRQQGQRLVEGDDMEDDEYDEDVEEESASESDHTASDEGAQRAQPQRRYARHPPVPAPAQQSRFSGPSPYQHPAQYPAPVGSQLPPHLPPPLPLTASSTSTQIPQRRMERPTGPPSAVPSVNTLPPGALFGGQSLQPPSLAQAPGPNPARSQAPPANLDRALDSIQTSLAALHERLNLIETTQNQISRSSVSQSSWLTNSPILQFLRLIFNRVLVLFRLRRASSTTITTLNGVRTSMISLLGRALVSLLANIRDLSRDAVAVIFLVTAVASLRNSNGDWRTVIRAWARILAFASGVGIARDNGFLEALTAQR